MATLTRLAEIPVSAVQRLGGARTRLLAELGITTVADLLQHVPYRYIDRTNQAPIRELPIGEEVTVVGRVLTAKKWKPRKNLTIVEARIGDESGSLTAVWFNQGFRYDQLQEGTEVALSGMVERYRGGLRMKSPDVDKLDAPHEGLVTGRVVPLHRKVAKLKRGDLRRGIHNALKRSRPIPDPIPEEYLRNRNLIDRDTAFANIHFPESMDDVAPARRRLAYDELFRLELALALRKRRQIEEAAGIAHQVGGELVSRFLNGLPYALTSAQTRVLEEIRADLQMPHPMHRLLQGEVGSGKTVVAVATLLHGIEGGWQTAIMAPTEVLAEQHYIGVRGLLAEAGLSPDWRPSELGMESLFGDDGPAVHLALLTGSTATANYDPDITRSRLLADIASGQVDLVVGTHALIQEGVEFRRLGIAVVDEQHRFGVAQRVQLRDKAEGADPDMLIMTATPIPRTLAMTLYGDLDVSVIDELPPGRRAVTTRWLPKAQEGLAWRQVMEAVAEGRQAFVVCPLVEDSPKIEAASATAEFERLSSLLDGARLGLIHGQLSSSAKEKVMAAFRAGEVDVLVSTTVIEVGIDVPNATIMVIEDAERFGLSQLHQLRGRVGRGSHPGTCLLIADASTTEAEERLSAIVEIIDGFRLAEVDLRIRGQGTVFGTRQSGMKDLRIADILTDFDLLTAARRDAFQLVAEDPDLSRHPELAEEIRALLGDAVEWLFVS